MPRLRICLWEVALLLAGDASASDPLAGGRVAASEGCLDPVSSLQSPVSSPGAGSRREAGVVRPDFTGGASEYCRAWRIRTAGIGDDRFEARRRDVGPGDSVGAAHRRSNLHRRPRTGDWRLETGDRPATPLPEATRPRARPTRHSLAGSHPTSRQTHPPVPTRRPALPYIPTASRCLPAANHPCTFGAARFSAAGSAWNSAKASANASFGSVRP